MKKMTRRITWLLILCFSTALPMTAALPARAMGSKGGEQPPPAAERAMEGKITIQKILKNAGELVNKEFLLEGAFQGWKGKCEESSPLTRSDWILKDETGCIYVSGKIPAGVSTLDPKGEPLVVSGVMKIKEGGKPYFQAKEVTQK
jgi:hypothetical protein